MTEEDDLALFSDEREAEIRAQVNAWMTRWALVFLVIGVALFACWVAGRIIWGMAL